MDLSDIPGYTSLPACSGEGISAVCTSCFFDASYTRLEPTFVFTGTSTVTPTVYVDVTTFANGSSTSNTVVVTETAAPSDPNTWVSDGLVFTYGSTYLNYTYFQYALPSAPTSNGQNSASCYLGDLYEVPTLSSLQLPAARETSSLILTLTSGEALPSQTVPAQILGYLDSLPAITEQLDNVPLTLCSPSTPVLTPSCTNTPANCPDPTSVVFTRTAITTTTILTRTLSRSASAQQATNDVRKRQIGGTTTSSTSSSSTSTTSGSSTSTTSTSSGSTSVSGSADISFPPGCPQTITITTATASVTSTGYVTATAKESRDFLAQGSPVYRTRSQTSLSPDAPPNTVSTTPLPQAPAPQPIQQGPSTPPSPPPVSAPPTSVPDQTVSAPPTVASPPSNPQAPSNPALLATTSPSTTDPLTQPANDPPAPGTATLDAIAVSVSAQIASISAAVASAIASASANSNFSPDELASFNSAAFAAASSSAAAESSVLDAASGASSVTYTTVEEVTAGISTTEYTTRVVTGTPPRSSTDIGGYINSGLNPSQERTSTTSGGPQAYTGLANRIGAVDVRGLLGVGMGMLMGV